MTRQVVAAALVAAAAFATPPAGAAPADCMSAYRYALTHNPWRPLPSGGGGGEPGGGPMPGHPFDWAEWNTAATVAFAKCLAG